MGLSRQREVVRPSSPVRFSSSTFHPGIVALFTFIGHHASSRVSPPLTYTRAYTHKKRTLPRLPCSTSDSTMYHAFLSAIHIHARTVITTASTHSILLHQSTLSLSLLVLPHPYHCHYSIRCIARQPILHLLQRLIPRYNLLGRLRPPVDSNVFYVYWHVLLISAISPCCLH